MNLADLKTDIMKKDVKRFYIFVGDEIGIINIYLEQIAKVKSLCIIRDETVANVWGKVSTRGMFASEPAIYVVRGDKDFQKQEQYWDNLISGIKDSVLILLYDKIDSRLKFGKHFKDNIVQFDKLDKPILEKYIMQKLPNIKRENAGLLADVCGGSYDIAMLECDKILTYSGEVNRTLTKLLKDGTIYQSQETDVFQFVDAVCNRDVDRTFLLARRLLEDGASSINMLGTLYTSLKAILLIQCCSGSNIAEITGLDNGTIFYNRRRTGKYSNGELVHAVRLIAQIIANIKSGYMDDVYATDFVLTSIL